MNGKQLKNSILQWAIQGKLVPQDPNDEPASVLLERIRKEKERLIKEKKIKKDKNASIIFRGEDNSYYEKFLATGEVKCIDEEIPFEIPQGWSVCRLNDLALYRKGPFGSSLTKSMFVPKSDTSIKVYEQKNAIQKNYELGEYYISQEKYKMMQSFIVEPSDIIVSCAGTIGETYQLPSTAPTGIINQALMRVKLYNLEMAKYWEMYFRYILLNETEMKGAGSAIKNIPPFEYLKAIIVAIPPIAEQKRIINRYHQLSTLSDRFDKLQKELNSLSNEICLSIKKSILQEAIQGKLVPQIAEEGTAQALLEQIRQEKQKLVKEGKLKKSALNGSVIYKGDDNKYYEQIGTKCIDISESIPFEVPIGWCWTRLSVISNLYTGNSISETEKATRYTNVQGMEYIGTKDVSFNHIVNYANGIAIPNEHISQFKIAPSRSVLLCIEGGSAGRKIAQIEKNVCFGNKLCCFVPYMMDISEYIYCYLQSPSFFENFRGNLAGIIGGVSVNTLKSLLIPLPPIEEQKRIVAQIEKLFEKLK